MTKEELLAMGAVPVEEYGVTEIPYTPHNDGFLETAYKSVVRGFLRIGKGIVGTAEEGYELISGVGEENFLTNWRGNIETAEKPFEVTPDSTLEWGASILGETLPYLGTTLIGGMYAKAFGAAIAFATEGQSAYDAAKKRGASETSANLERGVVGTINAAINSLQLGKIMKFADKGKLSLQSFRNGVKQTVYQKIREQGGKFTSQILKESIEQAVLGATQQGVRFAAPYMVEGKESLPLKEDGTIDTWAILEEIGGVAAASGIVASGLGVAKAVIPHLASPSMEKYKSIRQSIEDMPGSMEEKTARIRDFDLNWKRFTGQETSLPVQPKDKHEFDLKTIRQQYSTFLDRVDEWANKFGEARVLSKEEISKRRGVKFHEAMKYWESTKGNPNVTDQDRAAGMFSILKGSLRPEFDIEMSKEDYDIALAAISNSYKADSYDLVKAVEAFNKLYIEKVLPEPNEIKVLEPILGKSIVDKMLAGAEKYRRSGMTVGQKLISGVLEVANFPRAILASWDLSFSGRQGWMMMFKDPKIWVKSVGVGWRALLSKDFANFSEMDIKSNPDFRLANETMKVDYTEVGRPGGREEFFISKFAGKIPGVKASERAFTAAANYLRYKMAYKIIEDWRGTGKTKKDYEELGQIINHMTGRGNIKALKKYEAALNVGFFAPKTQMAKIQRVTDLNPVEMVNGRPNVRFSPAQRMLAFTWVKAVASGTGILYALSQIPGVKVERDPRSTDFGKIRFGDTRIDFWAGDTQIARVMAQTMLGQRKTSSGDIQDAERIDIAAKFLQSKLSPGAGLALDMYRGSDYKGNLLDPSAEGFAEQTLRRVAPLFLQDTTDIIQSNGWNIPSIAGSALSFHGVGVLTYSETAAASAKSLKNKLAREAFNADWDDLGELSQQMLRTYNPDIEEADRRASTERQDKKMSTKFITDIANSERELRKSFPIKTRDELDKLLVDVGGLSRKVGSGWYLNNTRYSQYKMLVKKELNEVLPQYITLDMDPFIKRDVIEFLIESIKQQIRQEIIMDANMKDLTRG